MRFTDRGHAAGALVDAPTLDTAQRVADWCAKNGRAWRNPEASRGDQAEVALTHTQRPAHTPQAHRRPVRPHHAIGRVGQRCEPGRNLAVAALDAALDDGKVAAVSVRARHGRDHVHHTAMLKGILLIGEHHRIGIAEDAIAPHAHDRHPRPRLVGEQATAIGHGAHAEAGVVPPLPFAPPNMLIGRVLVVGVTHVELAPVAAARNYPTLCALFSMPAEQVQGLVDVVEHPDFAAPHHSRHRTLGERADHFVMAGIAWHVEVVEIVVYARHVKLCAADTGVGGGLAGSAMDVDAGAHVHRPQPMHRLVLVPIPVQRVGLQLVYRLADRDVYLAMAHRARILRRVAGAVGAQKRGIVYRPMRGWTPCHLHLVVTVGGQRHRYSGFFTPVQGAIAVLVAHADQRCKAWLFGPDFDTGLVRIDLGNGRQFATGQG